MPKYIDKNKIYNSQDMKSLQSVVKNVWRIFVQECSNHSSKHDLQSVIFESIGETLDELMDCDHDEADEQESAKA